MPTLDSYFQSQGKSFDSYQRSLQEATPEELLMGGVGVGMLFDLYGKGDENISRYKHKAHDYLRQNGFILKSTQLHSWKYSFDKNKSLDLLLSDSSCVSMMILNDSSSANDLEMAKDVAQIVAGLIKFIQEERISSRLIVDCSGSAYEIKNYILTAEGFRIFQTD